MKNDKKYLLIAIFLFSIYFCMFWLPGIFLVDTNNIMLLSAHWWGWSILMHGVSIIVTSIVYLFKRALDQF